jgi:hypothetical protein
MVNILVFLIIGIFAALLFLNLYFRIKVLKVYKVLINNRIEFGKQHIFDKKKMQSEILPKYPGHQKEILLFVSHISYSIKIAIILIVLITLMGLILHFYK